MAHTHRLTVPPAAFLKAHCGVIGWLFISVPICTTCNDQSVPYGIEFAAPVVEEGAQVGVKHTGSQFQIAVAAAQLLLFALNHVLQELEVGEVATECH